MIVTHADLTPQTCPKRTMYVASPDKIFLMPIGDVHWGSRDFPRERFVKHIQWGVDQGAYFLGMGEYGDFTSGSQRALLNQLRSSQRARQDDWVQAEIHELFQSIEFSKGRWLGLLEGHHYWQFEDGTTSDQMLCALLDAPFLGTSTLFEIRIADPSRGRNGATITVFAHHGRSSASTPGGQLNELFRMEDTAEADIYLMGHTHSKVNTIRDRLYRTRSGYLYHRTKVFARTGGFLKGYAGQSPLSPLVHAEASRGMYPEQMALTPTSLGGIVLVLGYKRIQEAGSDLVIPDIYLSV